MAIVGKQPPIHIPCHLDQAFRRFQPLVVEMPLVTRVSTLVMAFVRTNFVSVEEATIATILVEELIMAQPLSQCVWKLFERPFA
jgi:hypothetical protein